MFVCACEIRINLVAWAVALTAALCLTPAQLAAEPVAATQAGGTAPSHETPSQHDEGQAEEAGHEESIWGTMAPLVNFLVLTGGLYYFLRTPLAGHLAGRAAGIRSALAEAESTRQAASAQLAEVEAKLQALPHEIDTLTQRGVEEIAAEEARIRHTTEEERSRMVAQARREIDLALRVAKQELMVHAAALAVDVASAHLRATMTPADQERLIARYVADVRQPYD